VSFARQSAQIPGLKQVRPAYRDRNEPGVQDVMQRLD
jgi:hypothetical protein